MVADPKKRFRGKAKPPTEVAEVQIGTIKYGDQDYKARPLDRDPNGAEVQHLVAAYSRYHSIKKAAKLVNIDFGKASGVIADAIKANPMLLSEGDPELWHGLTCQEIATEAMLLAFKKLDKLDANKLIYTNRIAQAQATAYFELFMKHGGAKKGDAKAIRKRIAEKEKAIAELRARAIDAQGAGASSGRGDAGGTSRALGVDAT